MHAKYEVSISYSSKVMAKVKSWRDRQTDRIKTICPRSFDLGALKKPDVFVKHECCHLQLSPKNYCKYMYQGCDQGHRVT